MKASLLIVAELAGSIVGTLTAVEEPHHQGQYYAEQNAGDHRKVKRRVFPANHDVAWKTPEPYVQSLADHHQGTEKDQTQTNKNESAAHLFDDIGVIRESLIPAVP